MEAPSKQLGEEGANNGAVRKTVNDLKVAGGSLKRKGQVEDAVEADDDVNDEDSDAESELDEDATRKSVDNKNGDSGSSRSYTNGNEQSPSPSSKTNTSHNSFSDSDLESEAPTESEPSPKRRKTANINGMEALKAHRLLKTNHEPFYQHKSCQEINKVAEKKRKRALPMCCDCKVKKSAGKGAGKEECRFLKFRRVYYNKQRALAVYEEGFADTSKTDEEQLKLWKPQKIAPELATEKISLAKSILDYVGDQFCLIAKLERETLDYLKDQREPKIISRIVIKDLREMCDVCSTTIFNFHWTCTKCGFAVCISCFKARKQVSNEEPVIKPYTDEDQFGWNTCRHLNRNNPHIPESLMLTKIIAGDTLEELSLQLHQLRQQHNIPAKCGCSPTVLLVTSNNNPSNGEVEAVQETNNKNEQVHSQQVEEHDDEEEEETELLDLFEDDDEMTGEGCPNNNAETSDTKRKENEPVLNEKLGVDQSLSAAEDESPVKLTNFVRKFGDVNYEIRVVPKRNISLSASKRTYPNVPHEWLCRGLLLRLLDPTNPENITMFQEQWKRGQPVIVSNVTGKLKKELWTPESFSDEFGQHKSPLINCITGKIVNSLRMREFWDGFEYVKKRIRDDDGNPMMLKLKDWPPGKDFNQMMPSRFEDLMNALPLGDYTYRNGELNLASRLPNFFSTPDLGPKMYIAYGSGLHLDKATTNLHLDISDAVNVIVYVGVVKDEEIPTHNEEVMKAINESDCDQLTINRVVKDKELPGALWHIYEPKDADKIRDLLNKEALSNSIKIEPHHDAIHDQSTYLDARLRNKLREEYNVIGYPILQCAGDAVFIPAGAPHQVRNLNNCIKIAEDFVSPENVGHCFHLTEEFRHLSDTHSNHEDKLQIKNIVYHTVKEAVGILQSLQP